MKKALLSIFPAILLSLCCHAQGPNVTSWLQNTTITGYGSYTVNVQLVQYSATYVYVSTGAIPEYSIGAWPTDPNVPSPQNIVAEFPRYPVKNTGTPTNVSLGSCGLWTNGVGIFNPMDGFHWSGSAWAMGPAFPGWNRNAYIFEGVSFDDCLGHPAPGGEYHNHVNPKCLYNELDSTTHSPIIGYAFDGFPIYGIYGYTDTSVASGTLRRMRTSYVLNTDTTRSGGPHPISTYPMGDCCEDYVYTPGAGDLDVHNGRWCHTPEYPAGTYAYFVTVDSALTPVYPFVLGPTYYGVVGSTNVHITPVGPDTTYISPTAVKNTVDNSIKYQIVPNPTEDYVYVYMDVASTNNVTAKLYNSMGQLVKTLTDMQPTIAYTLNMTDMPAGLYMLVFEGGGKMVTEKIVKK